MNKEQIQNGEAVRKRILKAIKTYIKQHGYSPTVREIGDMVGLKSSSSVQAHLLRMYETGALETDAGVGAPRAIRVPGMRICFREEE